MALPDSPDCDVKGHGPMFWAGVRHSGNKRVDTFRCRICGAEKTTTVENGK